MASAIKRIKADLSNLDTILEYYDSEMADHVDELTIDGRTYMNANARQPGLISFYDQIRCELEVMHEDLDHRYRIARAKALRRIQQSEGKQHPEKIMNMMIDDDKDGIALYKAMGEIKERLIKAKAIVTAFRDRGYSLGNLVKIRTGDFHHERMNIDE